jgi:hypothetical protein
MTKTEALELANFIRTQSKSETWADLTRRLLNKEITPVQYDWLYAFAEDGKPLPVDKLQAIAELIQKEFGGEIYDA